MSVTQVFEAGLNQAFDKNGTGATVVDKSGKTVPRLSVTNGSAVEVGPGTYLSAGHLFLGPIQDGSGNIYTYKTLNNYVTPSSVLNTSDPTARSISGTNKISSLINPTPYKPSITSMSTVHDLVGFKASTADNNPTGVVLFKTPSLAKFNAFFPTVNFEGYTAQANATTGVMSFTKDVHDGATVNSVTSNGLFTMNTPAPSGDSGSGVWANDKKGQSYVLGTIVGGSDSASQGNYLSQTEFNAIFPFQGTQPSTKTHNLVIGSSTGSDNVRGSYQTTDIVGEGNNNVYLSGGNGDAINFGSGTNNIAFGASAAGAADSGTTFILGAGTEVIQGGTANDKLVLLADRLWNKTTGAPTSSSVQTSSDTIQLLGGFGNIPGDTFSGYTAPSPGNFSMTTEAAVAGQTSQNPVDGLIGNYAYDVSYYQTKQSDGTIDISIYLHAPDLTTKYAPNLWDGEAIIKNFHQGDFGLTLTPNKDYENFVTGKIGFDEYNADYQANNAQFISGPVSSSFINDDPTVSWKGIDNQFNTVPTNATIATAFHNVTSSNGVAVS